MKKVLVANEENSSKIIYLMILSFGLCLVLFVIDAIVGHSWQYWYFVYNLLIGMLPPVVAWWITLRLTKLPWLSAVNIMLTLIWLGLLPNSFYMITDLIHLQDFVAIDLLYNIVMIMAFIFTSLIAGYLSLYLIHQELIKRIYYRWAHVLIGAIIFMSSFAIYLGRYLRWNSWDIIVNPAGILFDVSDTITSPSTHPEVFTTTITFFVLLSVMYIVIWQFVKIVRTSD